MSTLVGVHDEKSSAVSGQSKEIPNQPTGTWPTSWHSQAIPPYQCVKQHASSQWSPTILDTLSHVNQVGGIDSNKGHEGVIGTSIFSSIDLHFIFVLFIVSFHFICIHLILKGTKDVKTMQIQWNLVIKRSDITKPSYNKVILLVPSLYISLFFTLI